MMPNKLFDTGAQVHPRGKPRFYSLCAGHFYVKSHRMNSTMIKALTLLIVASVLLAGCATTESPIPESYDGPRAMVRDSMANVSSRQGDFCVLRSVDGRQISNSINETIERGRGKGLTLYAWVTDRRIPALPTKAGIRCQTVHAAPILALTGTVYSVEGTVEFAPVPDHRYVVKGVLAASGSSVWIEDAETGDVVTAKVTGAK